MQVGLGLIAGSAFIGCGAEPGGQTATDPAGKSAGASLGGFDVSSNKGGQLLHSLVKNGHLVQFVELKPGMVAVVEIGKLDEKPMVAPLGDRSLAEVYRGLESDEPPAALKLADERRAANAATQGKLTTAAESANGKGPEFYNTGEQQWFRGAFCNGADVCVQGWDWAFTGSINGHNETFIGWVGSEGTVNASLWLEYWYHKDPTWPWACGDCGSWWQEFDRVLVVPGHWVSLNVGGDWWLQGHLDGAGGGTQVSLAARR
jgi:hypothetical protein